MGNSLLKAASTRDKLLKLVPRDPNEPWHKWESRARNHENTRIGLRYRVLTERINAVVEAYIPFVRREAHRPSIRSTSQDDCFQAGILALRLAILNYDPKKGPFPSHARRYVKVYISQELHKFSSPISLNPRTYRDSQLQFFSWDSTKLLDRKGEYRTYEEIVPDNSSANPEGALIIMEYLDKLTKKERMLVEMRSDGKTFQEIANEFGISVHLTYKLFSKIVEKLSDIRKK